MIESICRFGTDERLFGILTSPETEIQIEDAPIAIILNAGIVHRIGPFRLHVDLARRLADQGITTLRIDLSGLGDSLPRTGLNDMENRAELDIALAMDELSKMTGNQKFVVIGLCSGAFNAHQIAVRDERIVGAVFLDGIVFRTLSYFFRYQVGRFFRPRFWRNALKRRFHYQNDENSRESAGQSLAEDEFFGKDLDQQKVINELETLRSRDTKMLFIYTEGFDDICSGKQFSEMFGIQPDHQVQVEYYAKAEHTFRLSANRNEVCSRITGWFGQQFDTSNLVQNSH